MSPREKAIISPLDNPEDKQEFKNLAQAWAFITKEEGIQYGIGKKNAPGAFKKRGWNLELVLVEQEEEEEE